MAPPLEVVYHRIELPEGGVADKLPTKALLQNNCGFVVIVGAAGLEFTVVVMGLLVAGFPLIHVALLVNLHLTTSLFRGAVFVNVGLLFIGTSVSLIYHE